MLTLQKEDFLNAFNHQESVLSFDLLFLTLLEQRLIWVATYIRKTINTSFIKNMLYMLHVTYIKHNLYTDFLLKLEKLLLKSFLTTDSQFKMNKISHCLNFNNLLFKHELQTFHLWYTCISQSISSLITLTYATVLSNYINDVFD